MSLVNAVDYSTEPLRILAIDPGTNTMGMSFFELCLYTGRITLVYGATYSADRYANFEGCAALALGDRLAKIQYHSANLSQILRQWRPHVIASEAPYMGRFPQAYAALVQCCNAITLSVYDYDPSQNVWFVDPPTAKLAVGALTRKGSKENVQESILALSDLYLAEHFYLSQLDEHGYDSVAVGYWACKVLQPQVVPRP